MLTACTEVQTYGAAAIEQRRVMNDLQARATMAATCDIALGACFRELSPMEQRYAGLVCGGIFPEMSEAAPAGRRAPFLGGARRRAAGGEQLAQLDEVALARRGAAPGQRHRPGRLGLGEAEEGDARVVELRRRG